MKTNENHEKKQNVPADGEPTRSAVTYRPNVDIVEREGELTLYADLPGVCPEDVDVQFERGVLRLRARVRSRWNLEGADWRHQEYGAGDFERTFTVGEQIDAQAISAECADGVLTLHLPKAAAVRSRQIPVQAG